MSAQNLPNTAKSSVNLAAGASSAGAVAQSIIEIMDHSGATPQECDFALDIVRKEVGRRISSDRLASIGS